MLVHVLILALATLATTSPIPTLLGKRDNAPVELKLQKRKGCVRQQGLGDVGDSAWQFAMEIGNQTLWFIFDTGSSDLWAVTTECLDPQCRAGAAKGDPRYDPTRDATLVDLGVPINFTYGPTAARTVASGELVQSEGLLADWKLDNLTFSAINSTNITISQADVAGIFGASFPALSVAYNRLFNLTAPANASDAELAKAYVCPPDYNLWPPLSRLAFDGSFGCPGYTLTLQRLTDPELSDVGLVTLGGLPSGIKESELTWAPVYLYPGQVVLEGLQFAEAVDKLAYGWVIEIEGITVNGHPIGNFSEPAYGLVDSGTSAMDFPADEAAQIGQLVGMDPTRHTMPCNISRLDMVVTIKGVDFPLDPIDFILPVTDNATECVTMIGVNDPPVPARVYKYTLGDPFLKSVLAFFSFGSSDFSDPPKIGLLSTLPSQADVDQRYSSLLPTQTYGTSGPVPTDTTSVADPRATTESTSAGSTRVSSVTSTSGGSTTVSSIESTSIALPTITRSKAL